MEKTKLFFDVLSSILRFIICIIALYAIINCENSRVKIEKENVDLMQFIKVSQPYLEDSINKQTSDEAYF